MKIPRLTAELSIGAATGLYRSGPAVGGQAAVVPMASLACLSGCIGPTTAATCAAKCADAPDPVTCIQQCSGATDASCIRACFGSPSK